MQVFERKSMFGFKETGVPATIDEIKKSLEPIGTLTCRNCNMVWEKWCESPMCAYVFIAGNKIAKRFWFCGVSEWWHSSIQHVQEEKVKDCNTHICICDCGTPIHVHISGHCMEGHYFNYEIESEMLEWKFEDNL